MASESRFWQRLSAGRVQGGWRVSEAQEAFVTSLARLSERLVLWLVAQKPWDMFKPYAPMLRTIALVITR